MLYRLPEVMTRTGLSRSTIYAMMAGERFPKPVKLNERANGWVASEIASWIESRIAEREAV